MLKVLVVDDEAGYRDKLSRYLVGQGYEVRTAASGREAIELGSHYRPDVLVADWMLRDRFHGLRVAEALRAVHPETKTILMTGFASPELESKAHDDEVCDFIEKPFDPGRLGRAIRSAASQPREATAGARIAVAQVDAAGSVSYANPTARELFARSGGHAMPTRLADLLAPGSSLDLDRAEQGWIEVAADGEPPRPWHLHSKRLPGDDWLVVLLENDGIEYSRMHPVVRMLLHDSDPAPILWRLEGRGLIVDEDSAIRELVMFLFEELGSICHAASSYQKGLELFERDAGIRFVILDCELPGDIGTVVERLRAHRSGVVILGHSELDRREELAAVGVSRFVAKPWRMNELLDALVPEHGN